MALFDYQRLSYWAMNSFLPATPHHLEAIHLDFYSSWRSNMEFQSVTDTRICLRIPYSIYFMMIYIYISIVYILYYIYISYYIYIYCITCIYYIYVLYYIIYIYHIISYIYIYIYIILLYIIYMYNILYYILLYIYISFQQPIQCSCSRTTVAMICATMMQPTGPKISGRKRWN